MNSALIAPENVEELAHGGQSRDAAVVVELTAEEKESVGSGLDAALGSLDHMLGFYDWPEDVFVQLHALKAQLICSKGLVKNIRNQSIDKTEKDNRE